MINTIAKIVTLGFWVVFTVGLVIAIPNETAATVINYTGYGLIVAHIIEVLVFSNRIKASDNPVLHGFQVLVFGFFHANTLPQPGQAAAK